MKDTKKKLELSTCLTSVEAALKSKDVSAALLVRTICEKHDADASPYSDILNALPSPDSTDSRPFLEWMTLLRESCGELATVLHTDLSLLFMARLSPAIDTVFSKPGGRDSRAIDEVLRTNLWEFVGDLHSGNEIVSDAEFGELIENVRKTDSRSETRGRENAAILYSHEDDLARVESLAAELTTRACVPVRIRLDASELPMKLAAASQEMLRAFKGRQRKTKDLAKQLLSGSRNSETSGLSSKDTLKVWEGVVEAHAFIGHRVVLILELDNVDTHTVPDLCNWLAEAVAPLHDRFIVVVGGIPTEAELENSKGTWAYHLESPEKTEGISQTIANDLARGEDLLDLTQEVHAIADAIASEQLKPPLVVGICGGWGAGKSFILELIERRLREIRSQDVPEKDALHVGHIYWIEFDAWTYSKKNLWASLMDQICSQFEEQLNIERIQAKDRDKEKPRIRDGIPPWVVRRQLKGLEPVDLDKLASLNVIDEDPKGFHELLARKEINLRERLTEARQEETTLKESREEALERDLPVRVTKNLVGELSKNFLRVLGVDKETLENLQEIGQVKEKINEDRAVLEKVRGAIRSPYAIPLILIGLAGLALSLISDLGWALPAGITSLFTSAVTAVSGVLNARKKIRVGIENAFADLKDRQESAREALAKEYDEKYGYDDKIKTNVTLQRNLKEKLEKLDESGIPLMELGDLHGFLEKIQNDEVYTKHLGLMNEVQEHLQDLSRYIGVVSQYRDGLTAVGDGKTYFPFERGKVRIVLAIDDLDRCPPPKVVEMMEAAQLLVKTDLFVVLVTLDLRYVTRAIEEEYKGILRHEEHPTGLDYIEKIIQLPYRVRPISEHHLQQFFGSQLERVVEDPSNGDDEEHDETPTPVGDIPPRTIRIPKRPLQKHVLQLAEGEFDNLVTACKRLELSPRAGKRIANVYKIWKLLWSQRGGEPTTENVKQAMVTILALSTVRPRLARHGLRKIDHLSRSAGGRRTTLNTMFRNLAEENGEPPNIQDLFAATKGVFGDVNVGKVGAQDLSLLTSFSFVGDDDIEEKDDKVVVQREAPRSASGKEPL